jgi:hypothetical protein
MEHEEHEKEHEKEHEEHDQAIFEPDRLAGTGDQQAQEKMFS